MEATINHFFASWLKYYIHLPLRDKKRTTHPLCFSCGITQYPTSIQMGVLQGIKQVLNEVLSHDKDVKVNHPASVIQQSSYIKKKPFFPLSPHLKDFLLLLWIQEWSNNNKYELNYPQLKWNCCFIFTMWGKYADGKVTLSDRNISSCVCRSNKILCWILPDASTEPPSSH